MVFYGLSKSGALVFPISDVTGDDQYGFIVVESRGFWRRVDVEDCELGGEGEKEFGS